MGKYKKFKNFWHVQTDPHNRRDEDGYRLWSNEYLVLLDKAPYGSILELGCGNGEFYERLGFNKSDYLGIDYSASMIDVFRTRYPAASVEVADATTYVPSRKFDLICSSGLIQYFPPKRLLMHLMNVSDSINPGGEVLHLGVPWRALMWEYYSGSVYSQKTNNWKSIPIFVGEQLGLMQRIGYWYSMDRIRAIASKANFKAVFYGSLSHPYRFHVRMIPDVTG